MAYVFEPYDVLQVLRDGKWLDYSTLRSAHEGAYAEAMVDGRGAMCRTTEYRIVKAFRPDTVKHVRVVEVG